MKRIIALATLLIAASPLAFGQTTQSQAGVVSNAGQQSGSNEQALRQIEQGMIDAFVKGDASYLERLLADTFIITEPDGVVRDKAGLIAIVKSGDLKYESLQNSEMKVQVYGNAAVVTYRSIDKGTFKGQDFTGPYRWTDVFVRQGGRWQLVATHGVRLAK